MVSFLPAVLIGGPPHAGKSVLFYSLTKALRDRGIPHHAIRACPDGEGNWSQEIEQDRVRLIRIPKDWTDEFVTRICRDLENRQLPMLVDMGGRPKESQACMFRHCTHSLLLLRADKEDDTRLWHHLTEINGLLPLAVLYSQLSGTPTVTVNDAIITGTFIGLERGALVQGPLFDALVARISSLFDSYSLEELEKAQLATAPAELVANLDSFIRSWSPQTKRWERALLPRLLEELPTDTPLAVYGSAPHWLYGALAVQTGWQPFYQFDPRIGWVTPPPLRISTESAPEIRVQLRQGAGATVLSVEILAEHLDYLEADDLPFPPVPVEAGLILDGKMPSWLLTALVRLYSKEDVAWIACHHPPSQGAVVVFTRTLAYKPGDLVPLPT